MESHMQINSLNSFSLATSQNKENVSNTLQRVAAMHAIDNSSPADLIQYNQQQSKMLEASQNIQNANESYAMLRISDSSLQSLRDGAMELQTQSVARNSAALNSEQKAMIDSQSNATLTAMRDTVSNTTYNGQNLLRDINIDSIDIQSSDSIENFTKMIDRELSSVGAASNAMASAIKEQSAALVGAAASKETKEYDLAELVQDNSANTMKLNASILAQAHATDILSQRMKSILA